ncbi:MAG: hypothetical protein WD055_01905 [Candidatus Dependentiae bacterium]
MLSYNKSLKALLGAAVLISLSQPMHAADGGKNFWAENSGSIFKASMFALGAFAGYFVGEQYNALERSNEYLLQENKNYKTKDEMIKQSEKINKAVEEYIAKQAEMENAKK